MIFIFASTVHTIAELVERHFIGSRQPRTYLIILVRTITQIEKSRIFSHLHDRIVVGSEEIELADRRVTQRKRISHLAKIGGDGNRHHRMSLVASALLILRNRFATAHRVSKRTSD